MGFTLVAIFVGATTIPSFVCAEHVGNSTVTINSSVLPVTVLTNSQSYNDGDKILIWGTTRDYIQGIPITIIIRNPVGNIVVIAQIPLTSNKTYSATIQTGGSLWQAAGTYEVDITYGTSDRSIKTTFQFTGSKSSSMPQTTIAVEGASLTISYGITNGKVLGMKTDSQSKSLLVAIKADDDGILTMTLHRTLIDAKTTSHDDQYYVLLDGQEADFDEIITTTTDRTLSIPFPGGTEEIEIIGTQVIPEFGQILALVFAIAVTAIILVSGKTDLRFMSRN